MPNVDQSTMNSVILLIVALLGIYNNFQNRKRDEKLKEIKATGEATHALSNGAMGTQLTMNVVLAKAAAVMAHRIASLTKQEGDIAAALASDVQVQEHERILERYLIQSAQADLAEAMNGLRPRNKKT